MRGISTKYRRLWVRVTAEEHDHLKAGAEILSLPGERRKTTSDLVRAGVDRVMLELGERRIFERRQQTIPVAVDRRVGDRRKPVPAPESPDV